MDNQERQPEPALTAEPVSIIPDELPTAPKPIGHEPSLGNLAGRGIFGGVLMGLANLVPGISGGTMLVAAGVYKRFIDAIADATRFRFRIRSMVLLGAVVFAAGLAIVGLAGPVKDLVVNYRWIMYSLFIGLTLGGIPVVSRMVHKQSSGLWIGLIVGAVGMSLLGVLQSMGYTGGGGEVSGWMLFAAGAVAAGAMILPGISGGYMLLILGVYVTILNGVDTLKIALKARDIDALKDVSLDLLLPVGLGMLVGIVVISNILKFLLHRYEKPTLGVLIGLLLGAVVGLWPFQQGNAPTPGDIFSGQTVIQLYNGQAHNDGVMVVDKERDDLLVWTKYGTDGEVADTKPYPAGLAMKETGKPIEVHKYPTSFFGPDRKQISGALGLMIFGFLLTTAIGQLSKEED